MTTFNTGNPIGSTDARDRSDNSENLDLAVNSLSQTFVDRLGLTRDTLEGVYQKSAYYRAGTFDAGYTLTNNRQTLAYGNVEYSWSGAFPKVVVAGSTPATSGGIGTTAWVDRTDLTLRADLASSSGSSMVGFIQSGAGVVPRTAQDKARETLSVADFGANGDGVSDDYPAFLAIVAAAREGQTVLVPYTAQGYVLSADPYPVASRTKSINWVFETGVKIIGGGANTVNSFRRLATNGWVVADGPWLYSTGQRIGEDLWRTTSKFSVETEGQTINSAYPLSVTGAFVNGSNIVTLSDMTNVIDGMIITSNISGFPSAATRIRIVSVAAKTVAMFKISGVTFVASNFTGTSGSASVTLGVWSNQVAQYIGLTSGYNTNAANDITQCGLNIVVNTLADFVGDVEGFEIDMQNYSGGTAKPWGALITGSGNSDCAEAIRIERSNNTWETGVKVFNSQGGVHINAQTYGIMIDDTYRDTVGGTAQIACGIRTYYLPENPNHDVLMATQIGNGTSMIRMYRYTDTSPTGAFLSLKSATGSSTLVEIGVAGGIKTFADSNVNSSGYAADSITCNGLTLRGSTNLKLGQTYVANTSMTQRGYVTVIDSAGNTLKLMVAN